MRNLEITINDTKLVIVRHTECVEIECNSADVAKDMAIKIAAMEVGGIGE